MTPTPEERANAIVVSGGAIAAALNAAIAAAIRAAENDALERAAQQFDGSLPKFVLYYPEISKVIRLLKHKDAA